VIGIKSEFNEFKLPVIPIILFLVYTLVITLAYVHVENQRAKNQKSLENIAEYIALDYQTMVLDRNITAIEQLVQKEIKWRSTSSED
jgi:hypothetical protein